MLAALQTINKILQTKDYNVIKTNCLTSEYFAGFEKEFRFIEDHYNKFGNVPDTITFLEKFPQFELTEVNETNDYLLDRLYEDLGYRRFVPFVTQLSKLTQEDSRAAYNYMLQSMSNLKPHTVMKGIDIIRSAQERYDLFMNKANNPDRMSIKTGLPELDAIFGGWDFGEELVTIVARTNQGKSWLLLKFLAESWKQGYRVGLYSGEMSHIKLGYRFDALFGHFSNRALVQGCQDGVNGYQEYIKNMCNMDNPFMIITQKEFGGRPTVQQLRNFVEENNIQILGVDQLSLMDDGRATMRDPTRIRLSHISEDLFLLSTEYKIPILALAQANRDGINKDDQTQAPGLENIKESDDIAHNSSKCLGMRQSNFGLVLDVIKNREGKVGDKLLYSWDIDTGTFDYIPSAGDAAPAQIRQQTTQQVKQDFAQPGAINPF